MVLHNHIDSKSPQSEPLLGDPKKKKFEPLLVESEVGRNLIS